MDLTRTEKSEAFCEAYKVCHAPFMRYCSALAYGRLDLEDLCQDILLSAWKNFDQIRDQKQLLHYLIRAAKNKSISHWRKPSFETVLIEKHDNRLLARGASPEQLLDVQILYKALDRLPDKQREALVMFEISGFTMAEIAEIQQSNEIAIKTLVSRGRQKLRDMLESSVSGNRAGSILQSIKSITL